MINFYWVYFDKKLILYPTTENKLLLPITQWLRKNSRKGPMKKGLSVCPSNGLSDCPSIQTFSWIGSLVFFNLYKWSMKLSVTWPDFFKTFFYTQNLENGAKIELFWIYWKFGHWFFQNLFFNEIWYCSLYPNTRIIWFLRYGLPKALGQSDCRNFKSTLSKIKRGNSLIFCMLIQIHEN